MSMTHKRNLDPSPSKADPFFKWAQNYTTGSIVALRGMGGTTFTESDREMLIDGLKVVRKVLVQPFGLGQHSRVPGGVSDQEFERALMMIVAACFQLWSSGKLEEIEVDDE